MELIIFNSFYLGQNALLNPGFVYKGHFGPFGGSQGFGGPLATPSKNRVPRVQLIKPKLTWLGFLDYPRYQSDYWVCISWFVNSFSKLFWCFMPKMAKIGTFSDPKWNKRPSPYATFWPWACCMGYSFNLDLLIPSPSYFDVSCQKWHILVHLLTPNGVKDPHHTQLSDPDHVVGVANLILICKILQQVILMFHAKNGTDRYIFWPQME